jgi:hypothetical protein
VPQFQRDHFSANTNAAQAAFVSPPVIKIFAARRVSGGENFLISKPAKPLAIFLNPGNGAATAAPLPWASNRLWLPARLDNEVLHLC